VVRHLLSGCGDCASLIGVFCGPLDLKPVPFGLPHAKAR
jgi:hypothetical protein